MNRTIRKKSDITEEILSPSNMTKTQLREWAIEQLQQKAVEMGKVPEKRTLWMWTAFVSKQHWVPGPGHWKQQD